MNVSNGRDIAAVAADRTASPIESREDRRRQILWSGVLQSARGPCNCLITDISSGGARISAVTSVEIGQAVTLIVTGLGLFRGSVVWTEPGTIGIRFSDDLGAGRA